MARRELCRVGSAPAIHKTEHTQYDTACVNAVSLTGRVVGEPELRRNRAGTDECRIKLAVPRYARSGRREPGVVYVDVTTFGEEARQCAARLAEGATVGLSGRLEDDGGSHVLIDQFDFL